MEITELRNKIKSEIEVIKKAEKLGGQSCGMPMPVAHLRHEDLGVEIIISNYRSQLRNRELAMALFELAIDEIVK